jgi:hypothetical protein
MVARLWDEGRVNSAIELEALRNHLGLRVPFSLFCSYPSAAMTRADHAELLSQVCCSHTAVVGGGPQLRSIKRFDLSADAPRASRRFVIETLAGLDCKPLIDEAALVVTELAANAVLQRGSSEHAGAVSARRRRPRSLHHRRRGEHVGSASHRRGHGRLGATPARSAAALIYELGRRGRSWHPELDPEALVRRGRAASIGVDPLAVDQVIAHGQEPNVACFPPPSGWHPSPHEPGHDRGVLIKCRGLRAAHREDEVIGGELELADDFLGGERSAPARHGRQQCLRMIKAAHRRPVTALEYARKLSDHVRRRHGADYARIGSSVSCE